MSEENKAIVQRFVDGVINQKNMATFDEVIASNAVAHHRVLRSRCIDGDQAFLRAETGYR